MRLFRRKDPKTSHPHATAMAHLQDAHKALSREDAAAAKHHIGHALRQVQLVTPSAPKVEPGSDAPDADDAPARTLAKPKALPMDLGGDDGTMTGMKVGIGTRQTLKKLNANRTK